MRGMFGRSCSLGQVSVPTDAHHDRIAQVITLQIASDDYALAQILFGL